MTYLSKFEAFYTSMKQNRWYWLFSLFCRLSLAFAFFAAGMVKIVGERFASGLSTLHPMGAYLEALHQTGYYYTFIGVAQVLAAILLLIPRTVVLGAILYFPIIVNIWILSFAVRFEGSFVTSPLMVFANLFILVWHYDRIKYLFIQPTKISGSSPKKKMSNGFPYIFFTAVIVTVGLVISLARFGYEVMPRNSYSDCSKQFIDQDNEERGLQFCTCIHENGMPLDTCLKKYYYSKE